ncbi:MAG: helix-turn-helix transcriptional regulator [Chlamydiales bacterium]|nr:helix-turn-helix transcriptional regulator [Chlamydiales bacterium]
MKLKDWMEKRGLKLKEVSRLLGCSKAHVSALCLGKKAPSLEMAARIEEATNFEVLVWDFIPERTQRFDVFLVQTEDNVSQ